MCLLHKLTTTFGNIFFLGIFENLIFYQNLTNHEIPPHFLSKLHF